MRVTSGFLKNQSIKAPKGTATRPTSEKLRQSVFNMCQHDIENAQFLDLFAGSGAMGIEALSRGAAHATFVEKDSLAAKALCSNLHTFNLTKLSTVHIGNVLTLLNTMKGKSFDLIYIDPPYEQKLAEKTLLLIDSLCLLSVEGTIFLEERWSKELIFPELKHLKIKKKKKMGSTVLYIVIRN